MIFYNVKIFTFLLLLFSVLYFAQIKQQKFKTISQTDKNFDISISDDYRSLENLENNETFKWLKTQNQYSKSVLEKIPNRQYYIDKRIEFDKRKSFFVDQINISGNDLYFYLLKRPEDKASKLFYRKGFKGKDVELFNPATYNVKGSSNKIISYIKPNYNGTKIVIALTEEGKEISEIVIYDLEKDRLLSDFISNSWPSDGGGVSWMPDNNSFIYLHYPETDPKNKLFLKNMSSVLYTIGQNSENLDVIFSKNNNPDLDIKSEDFPIVILPSVSGKYLFGEVSGAANFHDIYFKTAEETVNSNWKFLFKKTDKVSSYIVKGDKIIFISEKNDTNAVYETSIDNPDIENSKLIIKSIPDEIINGIFNIKDGFIFTCSKNGIEAKIYHFNAGEILPIKLPFAAGDISVNTKNEFSNDFWITCSGWKNEAERFKYSGSDKKFTSENLSPIVQYPEFKNMIVEELTVKSHDGQDIPLTLIYNNKLEKNSNTPLLIDAYGAYGTSMSPFFAKTYLLWVLNGGIAAIAHVRGGGEKGEKWHQGGYKETKPNSWKDLISCAEYMIGENYTKPEKIAIWGASAGGITVGRAMTERPDLFKAVIIESGILNPLRIESMPNGLNSVKEFGSTKNEIEFKSLLKMDAFQHLKKGEKYPATLITSGINDPRVAPWMPSKFAAKLINFNSSKNPILLKIDYEGGHGGSIPLAQRYSNIADIFAFAFWQLGNPDYQPKEN